MKNKLLIKLFVASEAFFFISLIISYGYYPQKMADGQASVASLDPKTTGIFTLFLLASSLTLWKARKEFIRKNHRALKSWLLATIVCGGIFLYGQVSEYLRLIEENITVSRNIFTSNFYTITGFHGLHVLLGLIALSILFGLAIAGDFKEGKSPAIESAEIYWHFVDAVWIVVFSVFYLIPMLT